MKNLPYFMEMFIPSKIIIAISPNELDFKIYLPEDREKKEENTLLVTRIVLWPIPSNFTVFPYMKILCSLSSEDLISKPHKDVCSLIQVTLICLQPPF